MIGSSAWFAREWLDIYLIMPRPTSDTRWKVSSSQLEELHKLHLTSVTPGKFWPSEIRDEQMIKFYLTFFFIPLLALTITTSLPSIPLLRLPAAAFTSDPRCGESCRACLQSGRWDVINIARAAAWWQLLWFAAVSPVGKGRDTCLKLSCGERKVEAGSSRRAGYVCAQGGWLKLISHFLVWLLLWDLTWSIEYFTLMIEVRQMLFKKGLKCSNPLWFWTK